MNCSHCGSEISDDANFCLRCGVRTDKGVKERVPIPWASDPSWRVEVEDALHKASNTIDVGIQEIRRSLHGVIEDVEKGLNKSRNEYPSSTEQISCNNCGHSNNEGSRYCIRCGKEL